MENMTVGEMRLELRSFEDSTPFQILMYNEKGEEDIIDIEAGSTGLTSDGEFLLDLTEETLNIQIKFEERLFQRCLDNTPKELQTEETVNLLLTMFGYDKGEGI